MYSVMMTKGRKYYKIIMITIIITVLIYRNSCHELQILLARQHTQNCAALQLQSKLNTLSLPKKKEVFLPSTFL